MPRTGHCCFGVLSSPFLPVSPDLWQRLLQGSRGNLSTVQPLPWCLDQGFLWSTCPRRVLQPRAVHAREHVHSSERLLSYSTLPISTSLVHLPLPPPPVPTIAQALTWTFPWSLGECPQARHISFIKPHAPNTLRAPLHSFRV